jgi:hypothetical protein
MTSFVKLYDFSLEGKNLSSLLQSVAKNTEPDDLILIVRDPVYPESGYSVKVFLNNMANRNEIYLGGRFHGNNDNGMRINEWYESNFENNRIINIEDKNEIGFIVVLGGSDRLEREQDFLSESQGWFNPSHFTREDKGDVVVYYKLQNI